MNEYYFSRLSPDEAYAYEGILKGLEWGSESINACGVTDSDMLRKVIQAVHFDHPELFNVDFWSISSRKKTDCMEYLPKYYYGYAEFHEKKAAIENKAEQIIQKLNGSKARSVYEKCLWLHDHMVRNCTYDEEAIKEGADIKGAYTIEGFFLNNTAVCAGIALAYRYLCKMAGIDAIFVSGNSIHPETKDYGNHAWNIIRAGNAAIQVDVTWDMCLTKKDGPVRYDYFFLPDIEMMRDHQYVGYPSCSNKEVNMYARRNALFTSSESIKDYLDRILENRAGKKRVFIQFKMIKRIETKEEISGLVREHISRKTNKAFSMSYTVNDRHSVFLFDVRFN
ncbi:MAG: hypothetical protein K5886_04385 [Lachnospiraceae bacterium]|nr:hypothetical protein [Lachnospiraceae bacterium]